MGTGVLLDLNAGTRSDIGVTISSYAIFNGSRVNGSYTATLSIANGASILVVTSGRDFIDGGEGDDTAVFSGMRSDYSITDQAGQLIVTRLSAQGDVATLVNVERFEFSNETLASFKVGPPQTPGEVFAGEAFRLYLAAFDRLPDGDGLGYHTKSLQNGVPLWEVARQFTAEGAMTRADVLVAFSESPENQALLHGLGQLPLLYPV